MNLRLIPREMTTFLVHSKLTKEKKFVGRLLIMNNEKEF